MTPYLQLVIKIMQENNAQDIRLLDMQEVCSFTDYFLICSGTSSRHIRSVSDLILEGLKKSGDLPSSVEGYRSADWVLIDFLNFVVHIFSQETRKFYNLERLWETANNIKIKEEC